MHVWTNHAEFRATRNGAMRFICADVFGLRIQASFCRVKRSSTAPVRIEALLTPARILAFALLAMHAGASIIGSLQPWH